MDFYRFFFNWGCARRVGLIQANTVEEAKSIFKEYYGPEVNDFTLRKIDFYDGVCEVYYGG